MTELCKGPGAGAHIITIISITRITVQTLPPLTHPAIIELMFPEAPATPAHTHADGGPSLADIVREETQGGRRIVRFLVSAMQADLQDAKSHHRVEASRQLIDLSVDETAAFIDSPIASLVREETQDARLIIRFLLSLIEGDIQDARMCHRLNASRLYARLDPAAARALTQDSHPRRSRDHDRRSREGGNPSHALPTGAVGAALHTAAAQQLADIIREETNDGRDIVRFFIDVMEGARTGFKERFRFAAAEKLIRLGYHDAAARCPDPAAHAPAAPDSPDPYAPDPAPETTWKWKSEWTHFEYPEDRTYDFSSYGEEDYDRDTYGHKALVHIFGDDETKSAANQAVLDYKVDQIEAQRAAVHSDHDTCQPSDPCPSCRVPDPPDDDSFGLHTYGYNALVYIYGDKAAARTGYTAAMTHKKRLALLAAADAHDPVDQDPRHFGNGPDPPDLVVP